MQKRGQTKGLWAVIGAVLAAAIIFLFTFFIIVFSGIVPSAAEQSAIGNFRFLGRTINELLEQPGLLITKTIELNVPNGFIIVGFDKDWHGDLKDTSTWGFSHGTVRNDKVEANWCSDGEGIQKPNQCFGKACICLYKETSAGDDFMEEGSGRNPDDVLDACIVFDGDVTISGPADNNLNLDGCEGETGTNDYDYDCPIDGARKYPRLSYGIPGWRDDFYEFLVIYGDCWDEWGIKSDVYIEKYIDIENPDNIYILVAANKTREIIRREQALKDITARKLLDNGMRALNANELDMAMRNFRQVVDSYPNTSFANNAKAQISNICNRTPRPAQCENIDPRYLP
jgi:hypothetical protein